MIPKDCIVVVGDGRKALVLRNHGNPLACDLRVEEVFSTAADPSTTEQGAEGGARAVKIDGRRSGGGQTDWRELSEQSFAKDVARAVEGLVEERGAPALVVVAPPKTLAELRRDLAPKVRQIVLAEVAKDLTGHPVAEIQRLLVD
ncbi:MAG: host attachment protein [Salinarimonadaceae bacterium]|nr:MAG: host attachment protein [Salinarimonadaceae bacterium]